MWRYESFARDDARSIAHLLSETYELPSARTIFCSIQRDALIKYEQAASEDLAKFLEKSESQRPGVIKRMQKDHNETTVIGFLVLAILAANRVAELIMLRDQWRTAFAPGRGYRVTTAALYEFSQELQKAIEYDWPGELMMDIDLDDGSEIECIDEAPPPPPPPPSEPPPEQKSRYQILALLDESARYGLDADGRLALAGGNGARIWQLICIDLTKQRLFVSLFESRPDDSTVLPMLSSLMEMSVPDHDVVLVAPKTTLKRIPGAVSSLQSRGHPVVEAKAGVSRWRETKWLDLYLDELYRESALINEPMPTIAEIGQISDDLSGMLSIDPGDPSANILKRRVQVGNHWQKILSVRDGPRADLLAKCIEAVSCDTEYRWADAGDQHDKEVKRLQRLHGNGRLSDYGKVMFTVLEGANAWADNPAKYADLKTSVADTVLACMAKMPIGYMGCPSIGLDLSDVVGRGSQKHAFLERVIFDRLRYPIPRAWFSPVHPAARFSGSFPPNTTNSRVSVGFWVKVAIAPLPAGVLKCIPGHARISKAIAANVDLEGVGIEVQADLHGAQSFSRIGGRGWVDNFFVWDKAAGTLLKFIQGDRSEYNKKYWFATEGGEKDVFMLATATMADIGSWKGVDRQWNSIAHAIEQSISATMERAGYQMPLKIQSRPLPFSQPYAESDPKMSLLLRF